MSIQDSDTQGGDHHTKFVPPMSSENHVYRVGVYLLRVVDPHLPQLGYNFHISPKIRILSKNILGRCLFDALF